MRLSASEFEPAWYSIVALAPKKISKTRNKRNRLRLKQRSSVWF